MPNSTRGPKENLRGGRGNFANDPQRASEAGRKGGQHSHMRSDSQGEHGRHASSGSNSHSRKSTSVDQDMEDEE